MRTRYALIARAAALALGIISTELFGSTMAFAQDAGGLVIPTTTAPLADDDQIARELGAVNYSMIDCSPTARSVRINIQYYSSWSSWWSHPYRIAIGEVQRRAILYAWANCPQEAVSGRDQYAVDYAAVYDPDGDPEYIASDLRSWSNSYYGSTYQWFGMADHSSENWWRPIWHFFYAVILVIIAVILFIQRERIARWWYFTFYPHPAAELVERAISSNAPLNGGALASALGELPAGSAVFRSVRLAQAEELFHRMQAVSEARIREQRKHAQSEYEKAALLSIQEAVALAAVALERAKALYRTSQSFGQGTY